MVEPKPVFFGRSRLEPVENKTGSETLLYTVYSVPLAQI